MGRKIRGRDCFLNRIDMQTVAHLPFSVQEHYNHCPVCATWFDMRDLSGVWEHLHLAACIEPQWSGGRRKGNEAWIPHKNVGSNPKLHNRICAATSGSTITN